MCIMVTVTITNRTTGQKASGLKRQEDCGLSTCSYSDNYSGSLLM